jgi:hypothetical protein
LSSIRISTICFSRPIRDGANTNNPDAGRVHMAVTIDSDSADGKHFRITLEKTGTDTGTVDVTTWQPGQNPQTSPGDRHTYSVFNVRAAHDGSQFVCQTHVFLFSPTITVTVHGPAPQHSPFIRVDISGVGPSDHPVTVADETRLKQFIVGCHFPSA